MTTEAKRSYQRAYYEKNRERLTQYGRQWHVEHRAKLLPAMKLASRAWYLRNKEQRALRWVKLKNDPEAYQNFKRMQKESYERHRAKRLAVGRTYYNNNKEKWDAKAQKRRARKVLAEGSFSAADIKALFRLQQGKCAVCRCPLVKRHIDHIMPLALGGSNWPSNLQLLCKQCNLEKHAKHPVDFMQEKGLLL